MPWAVEDVPDLSGKVIMVTGATSGIGLHAARIFTKRGAKVVMACRNTEKMNAVAATFRGEIPDADLVLMQIDTSDLDSVRRFAAEFQHMGIDAIDVLLLNAGVAYGPYKTSPQGFERHFATNHLGHWLLSGLLMPYIKDHPGARIVSVGSLGHLFVQGIDYDLVRGRNPTSYNQRQAYFQSKLANYWFVAALNRKLEAIKSPAVVVAAHPGSTVTGILDHMQEWFIKAFRAVWMYILPGAAQGAWPLIMAATDVNATRHSNYGPSRLYEMYGPPFSDARLSSVVGDDRLADELWQVSEEMCGFRYPT